jgi:hypothetical protein
MLMGVGSNADWSSSVSLGYKTGLSSSQSVSIGYEAAQGHIFNSVAIGAYSSINGGLRNVAIGYSTFGNASGMGHGGDEGPRDSIAIGYQAGYSAGTSSNNIFVGKNAGYNLQTGSYNIALGSSSLGSLQDGAYNVVIGSGALAQNVHGAYNTAIGEYGVLASSLGNENTAVGYAAGNALVIGNDNTFIGFGAGSSLTTGTGNVLLGGYTGASAPLSGGTGKDNHIVLSDGSGNVRLWINNTGTVTIAGVTAPRVTTTTTSAASYSWNSSVSDNFFFTAQNSSLTILADSASTPYNGQKALFRITATGGSSYTLTLTTGSAKSFRAIATVPSTITSGYTLYLGCVYDSNAGSGTGRWDVIAAREGAS